jgi:hypothetical protein
LECWKKLKPDFQIEKSLSLLHCSSRLTHQGKTRTPPGTAQSQVHLAWILYFTFLYCIHQTFTDLNVFN